MRNWLIVVSMVWAAAALAEDKPLPKPAAGSGEITIGDMVNAAQHRTLQAQPIVQGATAPIKVVPGPDPSAAPGAAVSRPIQEVEVIAIFGPMDNLMAKVDFADGGHDTVRRGDSVPKKGVVKEIRPYRVDIAYPRGRKKTAVKSYFLARMPEVGAEGK